MPLLQPAEGCAQHGRSMRESPSWMLPRVFDTGVFGTLREVNHVATNEYTHNAGISSHVEDTTCFGANLATLSMLEPVQLTLTPAEQELSGRSGV
eukprot:UN4121